MPRTARIALPSLVYPIISRGNNRKSVFNETEDFEKYLVMCRRYKEKFRFKLRHWVSMSNPIHLVLETTNGGGGGDFRKLF
jgi:putative transposase